MLKTLHVSALLLGALISANASAIECEVTNANVWNSGYQLDVAVTNKNGAAVNSWRVVLTYTGTPSITNSWNANLSASGNKVIASNVSWNGQLNTGAATSFGLQGTHRGQFVKPTCTIAGEVTPVPTAEPTVVPTVKPTSVPTAEPTAVPTLEPTPVPTVEPTAVPTLEPTTVPTAEPTAEPTAVPTLVPTPVPTAAPTPIPGDVVACSAKTANLWSTGFQIDVTISNNSSVAITSWEVELTWDNSSVTFGNGWSGSFSGSNPLSVSSEAHNGNLAAGESGSFGFQGGYSGVYSEPSCRVVAAKGIDGGNSNNPGAAYACGIDPTTIPSNDDWLTTQGNQIVDSAGKPVWLTGANWFGFNAGERVFHGIWSANMKALVRSMAERGINIVRVPISTELIKEWMEGVYEPVNVNTFANPELEGLNSIEIFDNFLLQAKSCGMKVLIDAHSALADNSGHVWPLWYRDNISSADFFDTWEWFADRYKNDDTIVAYDLENEPHGSPNGSAGATLSRAPGESWESYCTRKPLSAQTNFAKWDDSTDEHNWRYAAEVAASRILSINPKALILVEGIEATPKYGKWIDNKAGAGAYSDQCYDFNWWGGNLRLAKDLPVEVPGHNAQIMYSPHDYGPLVFMQPWFADGNFTRDSLREDVWMPNWLYLHEEKLSPLLIGEWGGFMDGGDNQKWMEALRDEIVEKRLHHTFWCVNPNSGDTGGLVDHDWSSWDEEKYGLLKPALWQYGGKFVGLDKVVPLGGNGATGLVRP